MFIGIPGLIAYSSNIKQGWRQPCFSCPPGNKSCLDDSRQTQTLSHYTTKPYHHNTCSSQPDMSHRPNPALSYATYHMAYLVRTAKFQTSGCSCQVFEIVSPAKCQPHSPFQDHQTNPPTPEVQQSSNKVHTECFVAKRLGWGRITMADRNCSYLPYSLNTLMRGEPRGGIFIPGWWFIGWYC